MEQAKNFYKAAYAENKMALVIVTNQDKHGSGVDKYLYEEVKSTIESHSGNLSKKQNFKKYRQKSTESKASDSKRFNNGMPLQDLPKLICMNSKVYDMILMRFQIKSNLKDEIRHESIKFVSYMLQFMLRDSFHLTELPLVHNVTVTPKYFKEFTFIDVEMHYSLEGKSRTDKIIASVMKAKEELQKNVSFKLYADMA